MPSLTITTRQTSSGPRYVVRYRLGGRAYPIVQAGAFRTLKEAKARRDWIGGLIATGQNPAEVLQATAARAPARTFAVWAEAYRQSRIDVAPSTAGNLASQLAVILRVFGPHDPATITTSDVQEWISGLSLKPSTVRRYLATLRLVLD